MRKFVGNIFPIAIVSSLVCFSLSPARAQVHDTFADGLSVSEHSGAMTGDVGSKKGQTHSDKRHTGTETQYLSNSFAPKLQGATNGTVGPQGVDATSIIGVNTAGTVRVNNLANLEALLNIIANGMEILGIAWGGPTMIMGFMHMAAGTHDAMKRVLFGCAGVTGGLATPGCINWLVASCRDANLFA